MESETIMVNQPTEEDLEIIEELAKRHGIQLSDPDPSFFDRIKMIFTGDAGNGYVTGSKHYFFGTSITLYQVLLLPVLLIIAIGIFWIVYKKKKRKFKNI